MPNCDRPVCDEQRIGNDKVTFAGVSYDYPHEGQSTWYYCICSGDSPSISHVLFDLCNDIDREDVLDSGTWGDDANELNSGGGDPSFGRDHSTDRTKGLKFDKDFRDGECRKYYFTLKGNYQSGEMRFLSKGGSGFDEGTICGPDATCEEEHEEEDDHEDHDEDHDDEDHDEDHEDDDHDDNDHDDEHDDDDHSCQIDEIILEGDPYCEGNGTYGLCFIVKGRGIPARPQSHFKVLVNDERATVTDYEKLSGNRGLRICLSNISNRGHRAVKLAIELKKRCKYTEDELYDEPDCEEEIDDEPCRITAVSLEEDPECQENDRYGICLIIEGEDLPATPTNDLKVVINHQPREVSSYELTDGGLRICLDDIPNEGVRNVEVFVQLNSRCSYTIREMYHEPDCREVDDRCYLTDIELDYGRCQNDGTYDVCFKIFGEYLPTNYDSAKVVIKNQPYPISDISEIDGGGRLVCVRGVRNEGVDSVEVFIRLQEACSWTEWALYDEPDLGCSPTANFLTPRDAILQVYPNPSTGRFQLYIEDIGRAEIVIINQMGQRIYHQRIDMQTETSIDLSRFDDGLYIIQLIGDGYRDIGRVLIRE